MAEEIQFQAPKSNIKKQAVRAIITGLRGYVQADINVEKARTIQEQNSAKINRENKAREIKEIQDWLQLQIGAVNAQTNRMKAEKENRQPLTETQKAQEKLDAAESAGVELSEAEKKEVLTGIKTVDPREKEKAERAEAERRVDERIEAGTAKKEDRLELIMAEERHIRSQAEPKAEEQTKTEEQLDAQINALQRIGQGQALMKHLAQGGDIDDFIAELDADAKEKYEREMQISGDAEVIPETTSQEKAADLQGEINRINKLAELTGKSVNQILIETGTLTPSDPTIQQQLETNLPVIEKFLKDYPDANFSALQLYQAATGQSVSANNKLDESEFTELVKAIQADIDANPDRHPPDANAVEMAYAWVGKAEEYKTLIAKENEKRYVTNPAIAPKRYRDRMLQGKDNDTIARTVDSNIKDMLNIVTGRIANKSAKSFADVQERLSTIVREAMKDDLVPDQYKIQELGEDMMLHATEGGSKIADHVDAYHASIKLGEKMMDVEKRIIEMAKQARSTGWTGGTLQSLLKHFGRSYDEVFTDLNVQLTEAYTTYLYEKSGKQTHQYEIKRIEAIFPQLKMTLNNNLATITGWYRTLNTEIYNRQKAVLGDDFAEMMPQSFHVGGYMTQEAMESDNVDEYVFGYRIGKRGDSNRYPPQQEGDTEQEGSGDRRDLPIGPRVVVDSNTATVDPTQESELETQTDEDEAQDSAATDDVAAPEETTEESDTEGSPTPEAAAPEKAEGETPNDGEGFSTAEEQEDLGGENAEETFTEESETVELTPEQQQWADDTVQDISEIIIHQPGTMQEQLDVVRNFLKGLNPQISNSIMSRIEDRLKEHHEKFPQADSEVIETDTSTGRRRELEPPLPPDLVDVPVQTTPIQPTSAGQQPTPLIQEANKWLGKMEAADKNDLMKYFDEAEIKYFGQSVDPTKVPWCAVFLNAALKKSGYKPLATDTYSARGFMKYGTESTGQVGDIAVWENHVGIVVEVGETIKILGGNQKDGVTITEKSEIDKKANGFLGYRTPIRNG